MRKKVYMTGGYNTISLGKDRSEFNSKNPNPGIEHYIKEAGKGTISQIGDSDNIDETIISNFMAARFNKQGNLPGFAPFIDEKLEFKPSSKVEGACGSGGIALVTAIKSIMAETSDVILTLGVEVQNTVKPIYGADILAGAGWYQRRKSGHAYFFPGLFSNRAGAYYEKYGYDKARAGMKRWFCNAIENARLDETAQEHQNRVQDLGALYDKYKPNGKNFVDNLSILDCSKYSDGASAIAICSEEGLEKIGINKADAVEVVGFSQMVRNITNDPTDLTEMETFKKAVRQAMENAGININQIGTIETHDCFSIAGILAIEALGITKNGEGADYVAAGNTARDGAMPMNTTGGLIGWGHPTGATGVHQAVTIWKQLTDKAGKAQINIPSDRPYGMTINMGGDDVIVTAIVYKRG